MNDKDNLTLRVGDVVAINKNVSPKYVGDAICVVTRVKHHRLDLTIEKMRPGGPSRHRRFNEGTKIVGIAAHLVTKVA